MQYNCGPAHYVKDACQLGYDQEHRANQPVQEQAANGGFVQVRALASSGIPQQGAERQQGRAEHPSQGNSKWAGFHSKGAKQGAWSDDEPQGKNQLHNEGDSEHGSHTIPPLDEWLTGPSDKWIF